jgi:hypothetical protein
MSKKGVMHMALEKEKKPRTKLEKLKAARNAARKVKNKPRGRAPASTDIYTFRLPKALAIRERITRIANYRSFQQRKSVTITSVLVELVNERLAQVEAEIRLELENGFLDDKKGKQSEIDF